MKYGENRGLLPLYNSASQSPSNGIVCNGKGTKSLANASEPEIKIFCCDLSYYTAQVQFIICCVSVFALYLLYGYFQELIFSLDGFKPHGWYLTLIQFGYCTMFGYFERKLTDPIHCGERRIPLRTYGFLAFLTLGTMGLSNSSLGYLNYPTQVIFKCCKLVPVLIGSILIQNKRPGPLDFLAAIAMCIGLAAFTLVDSTISPNFNVIGVMMISSALLFDAIIGNVQEKAMRDHNATNVEVVLYSYGIGFIYLLILLTISGNLLTSLRFCATYPIQTYGYAFLFSLSGYLGIQFVLTLVRTCGATVAATVTTARKAITIALSFIFFSKPFSIQYIWAGLIVVLGIYLNIFSKRNKMTSRELYFKLREFALTPFKYQHLIENYKKPKSMFNV